MARELEQIVVFSVSQGIFKTCSMGPHQNFRALRWLLCAVGEVRYLLKPIRSTHSLRYSRPAGSFWYAHIPMCGLKPYCGMLFGHTEHNFSWRFRTDGAQMGGRVIYPTPPPPCSPLDTRHEQLFRRTRLSQIAKQLLWFMGAGVEGSSKRNCSVRMVRLPRL